MEQKPQHSRYLGLLGSCLPESTAARASASADLVFVPAFGLLPRHLVSVSQPAALPAQERKWLGADFSHVIVAQ